jgi:N-acetylglucosaminyl-diphospho-decaprenol L-rhamnosyltransferase
MTDGSTARAASAPPSVAAVIVSYNSAADLAELLPSLVGSAVDVLVVDNASTDGSAEVARSAGARLIASDTNIGWSAGCNVGVAQTEADVIAFVNPDARPSPEDLLRLAAAVGEPGVGMTAPRFLDEEGSPQAFYFRFPSAWSGLFCFFGAGARIDRMLGRRHIARRTYDFGHDLPTDVDQPGAACVLVAASDFRRLGGFDESMFLFFSDTDLCRRLRDDGLRVDVGWDVEVRHRGGGSVRTLDDSVLQHHMHSDYLAYARRHYGPASRLLTGCGYVLLSGVVPALSQLLRGRPSAAARHLTLMRDGLRRARSGKPA